MEYQRLYRSRKDKVFGGVAGGLGEFFTIDPVMVRILFAVLAILGGGGVLIYILLWMFVPYKDDINFSANPKSEPAPQPMQEPKEPEVYNNDFDKKDNCHHHSKGSIFGAIVLITLGVLFLASNFTCINFNKLWPIILIVIGILLLFGNCKKKKSPANN